MVKVFFCIYIYSALNYGYHYHSENVNEKGYSKVSLYMHISIAIDEAEHAQILRSKMFRYGHKETLKNNKQNYQMHFYIHSVVNFAHLAIFNYWV